jgi:hypothetical protein
MTAPTPTTITPDEALARLETWVEEPSDETRGALVAAALDCATLAEKAEGREGNTSPPSRARAELKDATERLKAAAKAYRAEQVESVQTSTGSMGCRDDADRVREEIRQSPMIIEVEGETMAGAMLRARGCHIAYKDRDGRWRGVGSTKPGERLP